MRFTGRHHASRRDGVTVTNAQAEPAGGATTGSAEPAELVRSAVG